jgi:hypothetical protein
MTDCHAVLTDALRQNLQLADYTRQVADQLAEAMVQNGQLRALNAELLAALRKVRTEIEAHWNDEELGQEHCGMEVALAQARAAIAKAEGEA